MILAPPEVVEALLAQLPLGLPVEVDDLVVVPADDEQRGRGDVGQPVAGEVGTAPGQRPAHLRLRAALDPWRAVFGRRLAIEIVSHRARDAALAASDISGAPTRGLPYSSAAAARMLGFARELDLPAVLTNAVRHAERDQAPVVDVLDAIRRLVPLDSRHLDRANGEGHLADGARMERVAREVVHLAGVAPGAEQREVARLLADTRALADACRLEPVADLGIGEVHVPELDLLLPARTAGRSSLTRDRGPAALAAEALEADRHLRARCDAALTSYLDRSRHDPGRAQDRLDDELATIAALGFAGYFLTVGEVVDLIRDNGVRVAARGCWVRGCSVRGCWAGGRVGCSGRPGDGPASTVGTASTRLAGGTGELGRGREQGLVGDAERAGDEGEEGLHLADEVVGLALGDHPAQSGLGSGALARAGGEEGRPLDELGGHLREQHPGAAQPAAPTRAGAGASRQHRGRRPQRREMGPGVASLGVVGGPGGEQLALGAGEQVAALPGHGCRDEPGRGRAAGGDSGRDDGGAGERGGDPGGVGVQAGEVGRVEGQRAVSAHVGVLHLGAGVGSSGSGTGAGLGRVHAPEGRARA